MPGDDFLEPVLRGGSEAQVRAVKYCPCSLAHSDFATHRKKEKDQVKLCSEKEKVIN